MLVRALEGLARRGALGREPRPRLALGGPVRPAREPARPRARRPARARRLGARAVAPSAHRRRVDQPRPRRALERLPRPGETVGGATSRATRAARARTRRSQPRGSAPRARWSARVGRRPLRGEALAGLAEAGVVLELERGGADRRRADLRRRRGRERDRRRARRERELADAAAQLERRRVLCQLEIPAETSCGRSPGALVLPERGAGEGRPAGIVERPTSWW